MAARGRASRFTLDLRNVVAERGEDHVVDALWRDRGRRRSGWSASGSRPSRLGYIGVLHSELEAALGTLVELVPEAERAFLDQADIAGAGTGRPIELIHLHAVRRAAKIVRSHISVATACVS